MSSFLGAFDISIRLSVRDSDQVIKDFFLNKLGMLSGLIVPHSYVGDGVSTQN